MIHTSITQNWTVFLLRHKLTRSAIYGKPRNFEAYLCRSLYITFTTSFYPYAFYNKRYRTLFKDQLDRFKATCSLNKERDNDSIASYCQMIDMGTHFIAHNDNYNPG